MTAIDKQDINIPDPKRSKKLHAFDRLLSILDTLREHCPWDKKQTIKSLRHLTIEETYELNEAILSNNVNELKKELGDLLLHTLFYAKISDEENRFDLIDVINGLCQKLILRHPHIYGNVIANTEKQVKENWEKIKLKEKGNQSVLGGVPSTLPALIKSMRIQEKAAGVGFDWKSKKEVWNKVEEELQEFSTEKSKEKKTEEFGDLIFSLTNYARFIDINPEEALEQTNRKFIRRVQFIEKKTQEKGKTITDLSLEEMNHYWEEAKKKKIS